MNDYDYACGMGGRPGQGRVPDLEALDRALAGIEHGHYRWMAGAERTMPGELAYHISAIWTLRKTRLRLARALLASVR